MAEVDTSNILPRRQVIYCGACGMPPEYCEYGPDFESHCLPWLKQKHPDMYEELVAKRGISAKAASEAQAAKPERPSRPRNTEERLVAFYEKYVPEKLDTVPSLLEKYAGKEDKLFEALTKKYGPEPLDPYYSESEGEDEDSEDEGEEDDAEEGEKGAKGKRRGASAKKSSGPGETKVIVQSVAQKKKRHLTIVRGMETVPGIKLKDASKAFSKRFAGSSSVKENAKSEKEIIIQGDHMYEVAEFIVDKFGVSESAVFLDMDGDVVPLR
jgi:density-regulated protein